MTYYQILKYYHSWSLNNNLTLTTLIHTNRPLNINRKRVQIFILIT